MHAPQVLQRLARTKLKLVREVVSLTLAMTCSNLYILSVGHSLPSPVYLAGHNYIGTEHILLGLLREGEGVAARVLETLGADPSKIRTQVRPTCNLCMLSDHLCLFVCAVLIHTACHCVEVHVLLCPCVQGSKTGTRGHAMP